MKIARARISGRDVTTRVIKTTRTISDHEKVLRLDRNPRIGAVNHRIDLFIKRKTQSAPARIEQPTYASKNIQYVADLFKNINLCRSSLLVCVSTRGIWDTRIASITPSMSHAIHLLQFLFLMAIPLEISPSVDHRLW